MKTSGYAGLLRLLVLLSVGLFLLSELGDALDFLFGVTIGAAYRTVVAVGAVAYLIFRGGWVLPSLLLACWSSWKLWWPEFDQAATTHAYPVGPWWDSTKFLVGTQLALGLLMLVATYRQITR